MKAVMVTALVRVCSACQNVYGYVLCEEKVICSEKNSFCRMLCNLHVPETNGFCVGCLDIIMADRRKVA
jgi:hypothetical protein